MNTLHLAWPTTGNRDTLFESMRTLTENAVARGQSPILLVACDADVPKRREDTIKELRQIAQAGGLEGLVTTQKERWRFVEAAPRRFEPGVLEHALIPAEKLRHLGSVGTNRNAILMATAGGVVISTDDDVSAVAGRVSQPTAVEPEYNPSSLPAEVCRFADRESALGAIKQVDLDILGSHLAVLGRSLPGPVLLTTAGSYGDSGSGSARSFLLIEGARREEYYADQARYGSLRLSRETVRIPDKVYVGPGRHLMSMHMGLENSYVLPPFLPDGRGSDSLFALTLRVVHPKSLTGFLDFGLLHDPHTKRDGTLEALVGLRPSIADLLSAVVVALVPNRKIVASVERFANLGQSLFNLASSDLSDFTLFVHAEWSKAVGKYVQHLETLMERYHGEPEYWRRDVELHLDCLREVLREPTSIFGENGCGLSPEKFAEQTRLFGRILICWPELWKWAKGDPESRRGLVSNVT